MFVLGKLFWLVSGPGGLLVLLLLAGLVVQPRRPRAGRALLAAGTLGFIAIAALPLDRWALAPLENRFPPPIPPAHVDGIIVLGGAVNPNIAAAHGQASLNGAAERMTELLVLAHHYPQAKLVFTGGSASIWPNEPSEADVARVFFARQGLDVRRVTFEGRSRSTWENALFTRELVQPGAGETWLLVTSASHMPRAMGVFRKLGWNVLPWPVGYKTDNVWTIDLAPHLLQLDTAMHEWVGLLAYRLAGHSDAILPGAAQ